MDEGTLVRFEDQEELAPPQHKNFVTRTLLTKAVNPALSLHVSGIRPGGEIALHHHDDRSETFYITGGRALATMGGKEVEIGPGTCGHAPIGVPHGMKNVGEETVTMVAIFTPPLV
jgi:mannose-6-phosphate isomerase-like protein (cupin superfamily)